ncbi:MAG: hypothetical protein NXI31_24775 [bacterium]|nr:hypothetical protein [bacterium]
MAASAAVRNGPETVARRALVLAWICAPLPQAVWWLAAQLPAGVWSGGMPRWIVPVLVFLPFGQLAGPVAFLFGWLHWPAVVRTAGGRCLMLYFGVQLAVLGFGTLCWLRLFEPSHDVVDLIFRVVMWNLTVLAVAFPKASCGRYLAPAN